MSQHVGAPSVLGVQVNPKLLIRRIFQGFITYVLLRAKGLLTLPLLTRVLGPDGMGVVALAGATANLVWPLAVLGLHTGLAVQAVHLRSREEVRRAHSTVILTTVVTAVVGGAAVMAVIVACGSTLGLAGLRPYALAVASYIIAAGVKEVATTIPQVSQRTGLVSALNLTVDYGGTTLAILLVLMGSGPGGVVWADAFGFLVGAAWAFTHTVRRFGFSWSVDWNMLKACMAIALPLLPVSFGQWVLQALDSYFLAYYHGDSTVGVYSVAYTLSSVVLAVNAVLNFMYFPSAGALYQQGLDRLVRFTRQSLRVVAFVLGLACVGSALLAPWGVRLLAGHSYDGAVRVIPWVVGGYSAWTLTLIVQAVPIIVERRSKAVAWTYGITAVLNVLLNAILIPRGGALGAAVATTLSYVFGLAGMGRVAGRLAPGLIEWRTLLLPWLPAIVMLPLAVKWASPPGAPLWDPAVRVVVLIGAYLGLGLLMGIVRRRDWQLFRTGGEPEGGAH